jgi:predicted XRE-type DNA-binding protein
MTTNSQYHRIKELERKVKGMQRQINILNAAQDSYQSKNDKRIRDLEIKNAVLRKGLSQKKIAEIYQLSPGRVSQIVKRVA